MKKLLILLLFLLLPLLILSQKISMNRVPISVIFTFKIKFPQANKIHWFYDKKDKVYCALFNLEKVPHVCEFNSDGRWLVTEIDTDIDSIPKHIIDTINTNFTNYNIIEAQTLESPDDDQKVYLIYIDNDKKDVIVKISNTGEILEVKTYRYQ